MAQSVRFSGTADVSDRHGILRTDGRRQTRFTSDNNQENIDENKFVSSKPWILSTTILLCVIAALSYRGYLDTQAVNYPYQGPKVCYSNNFNNYNL